MELKQLNENSAELSRISEIYEEAFPQAEKVPLQTLFTPKNGSECRLCALKDEGEIVGLACIVLVLSDILYLWYLAIDKEKRGHNYGSKALQALKEAFSNRYISFLVEKPDENAANNEQRLERIRFYERADFVLTGESITMRGANYLIMSQSGAPSRPIAQLLQAAAAAAE